MPKGYNMQRIQLGAPYEEFIKKMISSGYYNTSTEFLEMPYVVKCLKCRRTEL
jgi:hypothetical protein